MEGRRIAKRDHMRDKRAADATLDEARDERTAPYWDSALR
jgi:hypothetical protein